MPASFRTVRTARPFNRFAAVVPVDVPQIHAIPPALLRSRRPLPVVAPEGRGFSCDGPFPARKKRRIVFGVMDVDADALKRSTRCHRLRVVGLALGALLLGGFAGRLALAEEDFVHA
jgi:hypothetical protein